MTAGEVITALGLAPHPEGARRRGLAGSVYDEVEARTALSAPLLALEVNSDPPNEP